MLTEGQAERLLDLLNDIAAICAVENVSAKVYEKIAKANTLIERSMYANKDDKGRQTELDFHQDWHSGVYDEDINGD